MAVKSNSLGCGIAFNTIGFGGGICNGGIPDAKESIEGPITGCDGISGGGCIENWCGNAGGGGGGGGTEPISLIAIGAQRLGGA